jgi:hypothetical protein
MSKLCPSAQPGMDQCTVLGVVQQKEGSTPSIIYLNQILPASSEVLAMAAPLRPTEVFRLAATCEEGKCPHFDGTDCRLATRIVKRLPPAVDNLPVCMIRKDCRWYAQEGGAACLRCPDVTTVNYDLSDKNREVSGLPIFVEERTVLK